MKSRTGFVSNSSSTSYLISYKEEGFLKNAQEILEYIQKNKRCQLYILGKELSEGRDFFYLSNDMKKLILRFPEQWIKVNGYKVQALVQEMFMKEYRSSRVSFEKDHPGKNPIEVYPSFMFFEEDYSCQYGDDKELADFYSYYILGEWPDDEDLELPSVKPYVILSRDSFSIENKEQWDSIVDSPESYPLMIAKGYKDKDFIRAMTMVGGIPDYGISYRDFFFFIDKEENRRLLKELYKKIRKRGVKVYTNAFLCTSGQSPHMYPLVFHAEPMFGSYMIFKDGKEIDKL